MGGKKPLRRPLWPPTRATASNYYPLGLDGAGGAAKPLLRAPKKPAPLHGRLPAFSGAVDAFERARKCFLEWRYFFSIILSEFLKNRVALQGGRAVFQKRNMESVTLGRMARTKAGLTAIEKAEPKTQERFSPARILPDQFPVLPPESTERFFRREKIPASGVPRNSSTTA